MTKNIDNSPLGAIRAKCLDCTCEQVGQVKHCHIRDCSLWPFRFGVMPDTAKKGGRDVTRKM